MKNRRGVTAKWKILSKISQVMCLHGALSRSGSVYVCRKCGKTFTKEDIE